MNSKNLRLYKEEHD